MKTLIHGSFFPVLKKEIQCAVLLMDFEEKNKVYIVYLDITNCWISLQVTL